MEVPDLLYLNKVEVAVWFCGEIFPDVCQPLMKALSLLHKCYVFAVAMMLCFFF